VRRLGRTLERARFGEYRELLERARAAGYEASSLERWVAAGFPAEQRLLILRHDVDQQPRAALVMAGIEQALGIASTWYFRWRTADAKVIARLREAGADVGFHYETLSRAARERGRTDDARDLVPECRELLGREVRRFAELHGEIRSISAHGDTRIPGVRNLDLLDREDARAYGVDFDANMVMRGRRISVWLTDRSASRGRWKDGVDPAPLLDRGSSPILCLTHPNNWTSGASLWADRLLGTRSDSPPW
jgi:hypothetical protein